MGIGCFRIPRRGHFHRRVLGLQGSRLGRILGLGPGGKFLVGTMARCRRVPPSSARVAHPGSDIGSRTSLRTIRLFPCVIWHFPDEKRTPGRFLRPFLQRHKHRTFARGHQRRRPVGGISAFDKSRGRFAAGRILRNA